MATNGQSEPGFRSGKNEIMGVLVFWEGWTEFAPAGNKRASHILTLFGLRVNLLERPDNQ
jgi:hypothetical protein